MNKYEGSKNSNNEFTIEYLKNLGKLHNNLLTLELLLRSCILKKRERKIQWDFFHKLKEGDKVTENDLTNYDTLGGVIESFNRSDISYKVKNKDKIIGIRDILAHGRLISFVDRPDKPQMLFKFGKKERSNLIPVEKVIELTPDWLRESNELIISEANEVNKSWEIMTEIMKKSKI